MTIDEGCRIPVLKIGIVVLNGRFYTVYDIDVSLTLNAPFSFLYFSISVLCAFTRIMTRQKK